LIAVKGCNISIGLVTKKIENI